MSGASLNNSRPLGPVEASSVQDTGIDLNNSSLNPLEDRASTAVRHQGDAAWKANQVDVPTESVRVDRSTATSAFGDARETNTVTSDFRGINQVGEEEYQRTLASMRSEGASDEQAYAVASETRNRVTSVGGTEIERAREALQKEQAPEALAGLEADGVEEGVAAADVERDAQTEAVGISEEEPLSNVEGDFEALEAALDNGNVLDLGVEEQFKIVTELKNQQLQELAGELDPELLAQIDTEFEAIREGLDSPGAPQELAIDTGTSPELQAALDKQLETVRSLKNRMGEELSEREKFQIALGAKEEEALTF